MNTRYFLSCLPCVHLVRRIAIISQLTALLFVSSGCVTGTLQTKEKIMRDPGVKSAYDQMSETEAVAILLRRIKKEKPSNGSPNWHGLPPGPQHGSGIDTVLYEMALHDPDRGRTEKWYAATMPGYSASYGGEIAHWSVPGWGGTVSYGSRFAVGVANYFFPDQPDGLLKDKSGLQISVRNGSEVNASSITFSDVRFLKIFRFYSLYGSREFVFDSYKMSKKERQEFLAALYKLCPNLR